MVWWKGIEIGRINQTGDYINEKLPNAHPKEFEFIDVYYVEHLFWQASQKTKEMGWPLVPTKLQSLYVAFHGKPAL